MRFLAIPVVLVLCCQTAHGQPTGKDLILKFRKTVGAGGPAVSTAYQIKYRGQRYLYSIVQGKLQGEAFDFVATITGHTDTPDKDRTEVEMKIGVVPFKYVEVVDGQSGWYQINDSEPAAMSKGLTAAKKVRDLHIDVFVGRESFDPKLWQFTAPKSTQVRGLEAWEFEASTKGLEPMTVSFAKDSGLLLRLKAKATDYELLPGAGEPKAESIMRELLFYEWKKFGDRMLPGHYEIFQNGVLWKQGEPVSVAFPKTLDPDLFVMPRMKK